MNVNDTLPLVTDEANPMTGTFREAPAMALNAVISIP